MFTISPSSSTIIVRKKLNVDDQKQIIASESYVPMQKVKNIFKIHFNYDLLICGHKESRLFIWLKQNSATNLPWNKDNHTMFTNREGKGMFLKNILKFW